MKRFLTALRDRTLGPRPRAAQERIVIFHMGRCGSTVLERQLKQHPDIIPDSEIYARAFDAARQKNPDLDAAEHTLNQFRAAERNHSDRRIYAFEVKFLTDLDIAHFDNDLERYLRFLSDLGISRAVVIRRNNVLRRLVSTAIAGKTGEWHPTRPIPEVRVTLDPRRVHLGGTMPLVEMIDRVEREYAQLSRLLGASMTDVLSLTYEADIERDPGVAYTKFLKFVDAPYRPAEVPLARVQTRGLREILANYDQVADHLSGTPHAWMLD